jgi:hypothetical protein
MQSEVLEIIGINDKVTIQFCFAAYKGTSYQPHAVGSTLPWCHPQKPWRKGYVGADGVGDLAGSRDWMDSPPLCLSQGQ